MMKSQITRRVRFEAAHYLPDHPSKCSKMHGHSWQAWVTLEGEVHESGVDEGLIVDMGDVGRYFAEHLEPHLDHEVLNDTLPVEYLPPTTENVARYLFDKFHSVFPEVISVKVHETENQTATFHARYRSGD